MTNKAGHETPGADGLHSTVTALLSEGIALCGDGGRPELVRRLQLAAARLGRPSTLLCVAGEFKKGKSSLINAMLGEDLCPTDDDLATSAITVLHHAPAPGAVVRASDDGDSKYEEVPLTAIEDYVSERGNPDNQRRVEMVEIGIPHPLLAAGLSIIDTPGIGGLSGTHTSAVVGFLPIADAVLLVTDSSVELSAPEIDFLRTAQETSPELLVAVTRIDLHPEWRRVVSADRELLAAAGISNEAVPVSAELQFEARRRGDEELGEESGIPRLLELIEERVLEPSRYLAAGRALDELETIGSRLGGQLRREKDALVDPERQARVIDDLEAATARVSRLRTAKSRWVTVLQDSVTDLRTETDYRIRRAFRDLIEDAEHQLADADPADDWDSFADHIQHRALEEVQATLAVIDSGADAIAARIGELLDTELDPPEWADAAGAGLGVGTGPTTEFEHSGIVSSGIEVLRGSYGGVLILGMVAGFAAIPLVGPLSLGAGAMFGTRQYAEMKRRRIQQRRQQGLAAVRKFLDQVQFELGNHTRRRLQELQRQFRTHFADYIDELGTRYAAAAESLKANLHQERAQSEARLQVIETGLRRLQALLRQVEAARLELKAATA